MAERWRLSVDLPPRMRPWLERESRANHCASMSEYISRIVFEKYLAAELAAEAKRLVPDEPEA